jgi:hypothetical protein
MTAKSIIAALPRVVRSERYVVTIVDGSARNVVVSALEIDDSGEWTNKPMTQHKLLSLIDVLENLTEAQAGA